MRRESPPHLLVTPQAVFQGRHRFLLDWSGDNGCIHYITKSSVRSTPVRMVRATIASLNAITLRLVRYRVSLLAIR